MTYRFVLEVPESLAAEANTLVSSVPDAQVHLIRDSHGLGFNDPYKDLSIACHSLVVIEVLYRWLAEFGKPYPEIRLVMHDGRRVSLPRADASLVVAAIRRDQPWVEHTVPQIGRHEPEFPSSEAVRSAPTGQFFPAIDRDDPHSFARRLETAPIVAVHNLGPAEQFYEEILDLHVVARASRNEHGELQPIDNEYDARIARLKATEADYVFLENGPLQLNLQRFTRGVPLPYGVDPRQIETSATSEHIATIRGRILINGYNLLESDDDDVLRLVDPFNVVWVIRAETSSEIAAPTALQG